MKAIDENILALNAYKAQRRQDEIDAYGKLISMRTVVYKSKKVYSRKQKYSVKYM